MSIDTIESAIQVFAGKVDSILGELRESLRAGETTRVTLDNRPALSTRSGMNLGSRSDLTPNPVDQAKSSAACAIFAAKSEYSQTCLRVLSTAGAGVEAVIAARTAGDAILRFAACAFRGIVGSDYCCSSDVRRLRDIADRYLHDSRKQSAR